MLQGLTPNPTNQIECQAGRQLGSIFQSLRYSVVKSDVILQLGPLEIRSIDAPLKTAFSEAVNLFTNTSFSRKEALRAKKGLSAFNSDRLIHVNVLTRGVIKD